MLNNTVCQKELLSSAGETIQLSIVHIQ